MSNDNNSMHETNNGLITGRSSKKSRVPKLRKKIVLILLILLLLLALVLTFVLTRQDKSAVKQSVCYQQIPKAKSLLLQPKENELFKLSQQIEKISGYKNDVDCLYIVTQGYISVSDPVKSRESHNLLTKVYKEDVGYDKEFDRVVTLPYQLEEIIKNLELQSQTQPTGTFFVEGE